MISSAPPRAPLGAAPSSGLPPTGSRDLNDLIVPSAFVLTQAVGINANGVILAIGRDADDTHSTDNHDAHEAPVRVFLLSPSGAKP